MAVKVAINGFGRIGRNVLRAIAESGRRDIEVVAINDLGPAETNAHLLRFDSVHGRFPGEVKVESDILRVTCESWSSGPIKVTAIKNPAELPWKALGVDIAMECTGIFTSKEKAKAHLDAGAKRVLVSAPSNGADLTVVYGVNHDKLTKDHLVVSNASCTTNCLAPVAKVLNDAVGIEKGFMTTIHAYTGDQPTLDTFHKDLYRARAAALSMIPTTTGAAKAVGLVLPELNGRLDGTSIRVPIPNVSVVDFKFLPKRETTKDEIHAAIKAAASRHLKGILGTVDQPNVSSDFNHDSHSSVFDLSQTKVMDGRLVRVLSWYDNEWGFSNRMADTAVAMGKLLGIGVSAHTSEAAMPASTGGRRIRTLSGAQLDGKTVLLRADLNVPMKDGKVTDDTRIKRLLPSINELASQGARVIVMSHFGRPKAKDPEMSLAGVARKLGELMPGKDVRFIPDCIGRGVKNRAASLFPGEVAVLENLRYYPGEEANDLAFAKEIAAIGDIYVNDAFSCAHRAHASTHAIATMLPAYAGLSMRAELAALSAALDLPRRPSAALVGGAKVSTKIAVLENLIPKVDALIIGGGMANTFLLAQGKPVGKSLAEPGLVETARRVMAAAGKANCRIVLPTDVAVAKEFKAGADSIVTSVDAVPADGMILDLGPVSAQAVADMLKTYKTLLWNGPLGAFEIEPFGAATFAVARAAADLTQAGTLVTVAGGGDTVAALNAAGVTERFSYVSTAGGAFLEWLEGKALPGVEVLMENAV
jgi:glyceraldehyde 3-phosphate dehydrogenase